MTDDRTGMKRRRPRRSKGCEPCRVRRMKCDEERPKCRECVKRGTEASCVYGENQIIFQSENAFVEQNYILKHDNAGGRGQNGRKRVAGELDQHAPLPRTMEFVNESARVRDGYVSEEKPLAFSTHPSGARKGSDRPAPPPSRSIQQIKSESPHSRSPSTSEGQPQYQAGINGHRPSFNTTPHGEWQVNPSVDKFAASWPTAVLTESAQLQSQEKTTTPWPSMLGAAEHWNMITRGLLTAHGSDSDAADIIELDGYDGGEDDLDGLLVRRKHLPPNEILPGKGFQSWSTGFNGRPLFTPQEIALNGFFNEWLPMEFVLGDPVRWTPYLQSSLHNSPILREAILALARVTCSHLAPMQRRENALAALEHHGAAVNLLQTELYNPHSILTDEVLAATCLHGTYEMALGISGDRVDMHIDGARRLIRLRGAKRGFGPPNSVINRVISGHMAEAVRHSLQTRERTFFAEPDWLEAARGSEPYKFSKWSGTELCILLLRLTNIVATGHYDLDAAIRLEQDIRAERARFLPSATWISNDLLVHKSSRARSANLTASPFGPESVCYDLAFSGAYYFTQAAIVFDYIILTLHSVYTPLSETDLGEADHECLSDLIRCVQYMTHDPVNQSVAALTDFWQPLIYAVHYARTMPELNWILHCFDITGIQSALRFGNTSKAWILAACQAPCLTPTEQRILKGFLLEKGIADVKQYMSEVEVIEAMSMGFRRNMGSTADGAPCMIIDPEDSTRLVGGGGSTGGGATHLSAERATSSISPTGARTRPSSGHTDNSGIGLDGSSNGNTSSDGLHSTPHSSIGNMQHNKHVRIEPTHA